MNKEELRKVYLEKRKRFTAYECKVMSQLIADNFFSCTEIQLSGSGCLHLFLPIQNTNEVDTYLIFNDLLKRFPNMTIAISRSNFENYSMEFFEYSASVKLVDNAYGIPEPESGRQIVPEQLDMVLIPLLVVDEKGNRIGYGKGFYDRFLKNCRPDCKKIGLSFEKPVTQIIPDLYDVPLDLCITPEKVYNFRKE